MDIYRQYFVKIDDLRKEHDISIDDFCDNVCSDRQYRRYISGENTISHDRFSKFLQKLSITPDEFYALFYKSEDVLFQKIRKLYAAIISYRFEDAKDLLVELEKTSLLTEENERFFELCHIMYNYEQKKITPYNAADKLKALINYPKCINKNNFTFIEIEAMNNIVIITGPLKVVEDAYNLKKVLDNDRFYYLSSSNRDVLPSIYLNLCRTFGMNGLIDDALDIATLGIKYCYKIFDNRYLIDLQYLKSLCLYRLGHRDEAFTWAGRCIATCISLGDENKLEKYNKLFHKEQGYSFEITTFK